MLDHKHTVKPGTLTVGIQVALLVEGLEVLIPASLGSLGMEIRQAIL